MRRDSFGLSPRGMSLQKSTLHKNKVNISDLNQMLEILDKYTIKKIINTFLRDKPEFIFVDLRLAKEKLVRKIIDYLSKNTSYIDEIYEYINSKNCKNSNGIFKYKKSFEHTLEKIKEIMSKYSYGQVYENYKDSVFKHLALHIITEGEIVPGNTFICNDLGLVHALDDLKNKFKVDIVLYDIEKNDEGNYMPAVIKIKRDKRKVVFIYVDEKDPDMLKILSHFEPYLFLDLKFVNELDVKNHIENKIKSSLISVETINVTETEMLLNVLLNKLFSKNSIIDRYYLKVIDNIINEIIMYKIENLVDELTLEELEHIVINYI